jgi:NIMA (never in mitosis gene a)-related kinase
MCRKENVMIEENRRKDWSEQILNGLRYLHSLRVVHRDIKPANILITDNYQRIKYADFGLGIQQESTHELLKSKCGSRRYMAPEIDSECYDEKCDVWSVGCVLYELSLLRYAFDSDDGKNDLSIKIRNGLYIRLPNDNIFKDLIEK